MDLNENQLAVVQADNSPMLVVAGPGAGKTTVLRMRIERLLNESAHRKFKILGITFTTVAASALRERLEGIDESQLERVEIGTFHAFAARILQQHGSHIGVAPNFNIVSAYQDRVAILKEVMANIGMAGDARRFLPLLDRLYERDAQSKTLDDILQREDFPDGLPDLVQGYVAASISKSQLDFPLLIYLCNDLLRRFPVLAAQLRKVYNYVCVDEFQDTNDAQFHLLELLVGNSPDGLLLLADQDQLIYQWNGASPQRLHDAKERFSLEVLLLPTSFRCPTAVLAAANSLIAHNETRFVKPSFVSSTDRSGSVAIYDLQDEAAERQWIAQRLIEIPEEERSHVVVLARSRRLLEPCLRVCENRDIPVILPTPRYEFESAPLVMLHNVFRLASLPDSESALERVCGSFYEMTGRSMDPLAIRAQAETSSVTPLETFFQILKPKATSSQFQRLYQVVMDDLAARKQFRGVSDAFFAWVEHISQDRAKTAYMASYNDEKALWHDFEIKHRGLQSDNVTLREFVQALDLESKMPPYDGKITFLTAHGAKGLEFKTVILMGAAENQFPAFQAVSLGAKSDPMEEERRSFFVAITRCSQELIITFARRYSGYATGPSRFIREMGIDDALAGQDDIVR